VNITHDILILHDTEVMCNIVIFELIKRADGQLFNIR